MVSIIHAHEPIFNSQVDKIIKKARYPKSRENKTILHQIHQT